MTSSPCACNPSRSFRLRLAATCRALRGQQQLWFAGGGLTVVLPADAADAAKGLAAWLQRYPGKQRVGWQCCSC